MPLTVVPTVPLWWAPMMGLYGGPYGGPYGRPYAAPKELPHKSYGGPVMGLIVTL